MGTVYLGVDSAGCHVAVKVIRAELARVAEFRASLQREAESARRVARFCTAAVLDVDAHADPPYLVVEYVDGPTLADAVTSRGPLSQAELHQLAVSITTALMAIHRAGIVHRDLNPSNIMLSRLGPKVIDFGIARALDSTSISTGDRAVGTPAFMAPEQVRGESVTSAADVFAWGAVLVFAASGRPPFGRGPAASLMHRTVNDSPDLGGIEGGIRDLVEAAMHKSPADRPTADELYLRLLDLRPASPAADNPAADANPGPDGMPALTRPPSAAGPSPGGHTSVPPRSTGGRWAATPDQQQPGTPGGVSAHAAPGAANEYAASSGHSPHGTHGTHGGQAAREAGHQPVDLRYSDTFADPDVTLVTLQPEDVVDVPVPVPVPVTADASAYPDGSQAGSDPPVSGTRLRVRGRRRALLFVVAAGVAIMIFLVTQLATGAPRPVAARDPEWVAANALQLLSTDAAPARRLALAAYRVAPESRVTRAALVAAFGAGIARTTIQAGTGAVLAGEFSPDGKTIASGAADGAVTLWDVSGGSWPVESAVLRGHTGGAYSVAFDPSGTVLASGGADGTVVLWDVADRENARQRAVFRPPAGAVHAVAFSPDGKTLASGSADGTVALWNVMDPTRPTELAARDGRAGGVRSVAFAARRSRLAFAGDDGTVRLWDVRDVAHPVEWALMSGHARGVQSVAFDGSGEVLASAGPEGTVRLWDLGDAVYPVERATVSGFVDTVNAVAFSPDGSLVAAAGGDRTVTLASVSTPARLAVLHSHARPVSAVGFSPDGKTLLSAGDDGTLKLWDLDPERLAASACRVPANQISQEEWAGNFGGLAYRPPCPEHVREPPPGW